MSEEQIEENSQTDDLDIEALQANIEGIITDEPELEQEEVIKEPNEPEFDLDAALNGTEPVDLTGKISEEDAETKASERGWNKEGVDKYGHRISAVEFLERTPFFKKMDLMRGDIDKAQQQLNKVLEQNQQIAKKAIEDKKTLNEQLKAAKEKLLSQDFLDEEGIKQVKDIDSKIDANVITEPESEDPIVQDYAIAKEEFKNDNDWYGSNRAMTALADKVGTEYAIKYEKDNGHLPDAKEFFKYVIDEVKQDFPDKPETARQTKVNSGNRVVTNTNKSKKKTLADLPEEAKALAKEVMEATGLTEDDYLKTYKF
jgi:hypothetical protein